MPSRRDFLARSTLAAAAALLPAQYASAAMTSISRWTFLPLIGQRVRIFTENQGAVPLTLKGLREGPQDPHLDQFSLVFKGSDDSAPTTMNELVRLYHPETGTLLLHMESSSLADRTYVSTFSLLV